MNLTCKTITGEKIEMLDPLLVAKNIVEDKDIVSVTRKKNFIRELNFLMISDNPKINKIRKLINKEKEKIVYRRSLNICNDIIYEDFLNRILLCI